MADEPKNVYYFSQTKTDGDATLRELLGGKGANLAEMSRIGLPVPPGFTITTDVCTYFTQNDRSYPYGLREEAAEAVAFLETQTGKIFGDSENPLLFSVRSGSRESMPGMMDTILNLGLNDQTVQALGRQTSNDRFAWDCYRRFVQMYGDVVMGVQPRDDHEHEPFDEVMDALKVECGAQQDADLTADDLQELIRRYNRLIKQRTGRKFPQDPVEQLWGAVGAVFGSWDNERAVVYRRRYHIPSDWGTAVNVQTMAFGNMGEDSGTGVAFTRDPATGEKIFYGEYLLNAQGEDVVAGVRTPKPVAQLAEEMPEAYEELERIRGVLERQFRDMQDFEFTIERNTVYLLQTRNGKRTGLAAIRIAAEMANEGLVDWKAAIQTIPPDSLEHILAPVFDSEGLRQAAADDRLLARGLPAGPGAASGKIVFSADAAEKMSAEGNKVVLARIETSPEDLRGMLASDGILTARGGVSSHAALVARQMGKVCVCGCGDLNINYERREMQVAGRVLREGDEISIDGSTGQVFEGSINTAPSEVIQALIDNREEAKESRTYKLYAQIMEWADQARKLGVRTNADQPDQAANAIAFGAEGIGLCRTEHMFFEGDRIVAVREMILAESEEGRRNALAKLLPIQREDFENIFRAMDGLPVTIRTLDPPLHEFLPHTEREMEQVAQELGVSIDAVKASVAGLEEANPMLGHRGCRLGIAYPEITETQAQAIFEAAVNVAREGVDVQPEIMVPLVGTRKELTLQRKVIDDAAKRVFEEKGQAVEYLVGTMIEVPRAALVANQIAEDADFFSFGTNDLTQTAFGLSRDDAPRFLPIYIERDIYLGDPFVAIDLDGVGQLIEMGTVKGRETRSGLKVGICGEHGGDPSSVAFCHKAGLDYVSCSPFRVPIARLAAAQAALKDDA